MHGPGVTRAQLSERAALLCGYIRACELVGGKNHRARGELWELLTDHLGHARLASKVCR